METPGYLVFHNVAEFFSVMVSLSIFGAGWYTYEQSKDRHALFLSSAFLAIGLMDFMHALAYAGMPAFITDNSANKSTQYWISVRLFTASAFLASAFIQPGRARPWLVKPVLLTAALAVPSLVFIGITFFPSHMPATFIEGVGLTPFKKVSEYLIILLLALASVIYGKRMRRTGDLLVAYYLVAFILCIFSELVFAVYKSVFDTFNVLGHLYKVGAFYLIYRGTFASSVRNPYLKLADANEKLRTEIAGHKEAEERLQLASGYNRTLIEASLDPLVTIGQDGKINDVNAATEAVTGMNRRALIGTDFSTYFIESERARAGYEQAFREGSVRDYPLEIRGANGHTTPVLYNATVYRDEGGNVIGVFAAARDVTERKRAEQAIQRYNVELEEKVRERTRELEQGRQEVEHAKVQAESANKSKSDFLANMSHELRTPLNAVLGFSEVMQDELYGPLNEKQREYVNNIHSSGRHLLNLINDILDLSKVESGKMELELCRFSPRAILEAALTMVREKAVKHRISLELDVAPGAEREIEADERKLKQILFNLLSNAVKFTQDGGSVQVRARRVTSGERQAAMEGQKNFLTHDHGPLTPGGDFIEISVADTGIGIKQEDIPRLFHEFTQLEPAHTKNHDGTGLGLALVKKLVDLHGGVIGVKSEFGKGSVFFISLPADQTRRRTEEGC